MANSGGGCWLPNESQTITGNLTIGSGAALVGASGSVLTSCSLTDATITGTTTIGAGATLTAPTLTTPTMSSPVITGPGYEKVAVVSLAGAAWHTGNGTADFLSWTVPATGVVTRVIVNITTKSTGAATADIGYTATNDHTGADNLLDGLDIGTAAILADNFGTPGSNGKYLIGMTSAKWVTFHANADPTGTVGNAYIYYMTFA